MHLRSIAASSLFLCSLAPVFGQGVITTIAGTDWLFPGDGRSALNAPLSGAFGLDLALDGKGNLFIADFGNRMAMRLGSDGIVNVIAGNGINVISGDGGLAVNAGLLLPISIAADRSGNIYLGEYGGRIRKVTPDGIITTIAGTGQSGFRGDGGPAIDAQLYGPSGLVVDSSGAIYVADTQNYRVRKITPDGIINTIAGTGVPGFSGDGKLATAAQLNYPLRIAIDSAGNLYITDQVNEITSVPNARIRKVDANGIITTFAGGGSDAGDGIPATSADILPAAVAVDSGGAVYFADQFCYCIRRVDLQGRLATIAGGSDKPGFSGDGGPARQALLNFSSSSLGVDPSGNIYFADDLNARVRRIGNDGIINTIAGNGLFHFSGDGGPATSATLDFPTGIAQDKAGNIYVTEPFLQRIRRVAPDGSISVYAGNGVPGYSGDNGPATDASLRLPEYLAFAPNGSLLFSDSENCVIRAIDGKGIITTYAGSGNCVFSGDARPSSEASFRAPRGIDFDGAGDLVIADTLNHRIRVLLASDGKVYTLAGTGVAGYSGDGDSAPNKAQINRPTGVRVHDTGVYFCDTGNNVIRRVDLTSLIITTVAGNGKADYRGDGGPATKASLSGPTGVNFDSSGNMYIADTSNSEIRKVAPDGTITAFAGYSTNGELGDGGQAQNAFIGAPEDLFVDPAGNLIYSDLYSNRVREILFNRPSFQINLRNLAFTAPAGSSPVNQIIDVTGSISGVLFKTSTSSSGWLQVSSMTGAMPASLGVTADPSKLAPGSYQGSVTITAADANPSALTVLIALTITAAGQPSLSLNPAALTFSFVKQSAARARPIIVSNVGGGSLSFDATTSTTSGGSWLRASAGSGTVTGFASKALNITADPSGLAPGTYSGTVTVSSDSPAQSVIVPVTITVSAVPQTILIPQTGLSFFAVEAGGPPPPQFFSILNSGSGQMPWSVSATTLSGGSWLSVFPQGGETDAASTLVPQIRANINPQGLTAGTYYGTIQVSAPGADNNPQFVSIILSVLPPGSTIGPIAQPSGMIFAGVAGAESPGSQTITVQSTSLTPLTFTSGHVTVDGADWFTSLPAAATVTPSQPVRIVIQPKTRGLAPGVYRGTLTLSFSDGTNRAVALVLVVIPSGSSPPLNQSNRDQRVRDAQASCIPKTLAPVFTLLSDGLRLPTGYPGQVAVKVVDDCANPMTSGGVTVSFSNGDAPARLISLKDGTWAATWTPEHSVSQVVVTANAQVPEQNLKGQVQIKVGLQTSDQQPVIGAGAVLNTASFAAQGPLAPGTMITLFGSKLSQGPVSATNVPLPISLGGSSILIAGRQIPLLFASDTQVIAVIPYGIGVNTVQQVVALRGNSISVPQPVTLAAAAPGIFTVDNSGNGQGKIFGLDEAGNQTYADSTHPVKAGDVIIVYCTGLGEVDPPVTAGSPASLTQFSATVNPVTLSVGGVPASVQSSGLMPGSVGLYQVNATVPSGVAPGDQVPVVMSAAGQFSPPVTIAVR